MKPLFILALLALAGCASTSDGGLSVGVGKVMNGGYPPINFNAPVKVAPAHRTPPTDVPTCREWFC